jgi:hypothetical protein
VRWANCTARAGSKVITDILGSKGSGSGYPGPAMHPLGA